MRREIPVDIGIGCRRYARSVLPLTTPARLRTDEFQTRDAEMTPGGMVGQLAER